ncbi:anti-sigma factor antagonist [Ornithinibacillus halotolerans]|uniref:Anti-sigma factor antagonist n=1 Tax=Ornithinibacillus halotolerans TaxID=1274357 RepID=A0A916SBM5_9BACI|nr:anti-sigma factor antagonist [Ornithinibacillus halotolerans]GGA92628.1 anti-sigma-B factor antagonist [Ornithinibacillus halotolerans]
MNLQIQIDSKNNLSIVHLSGEIDVYTAPKLKEALLPLTKTHNGLVEVDLEKVSYMDSTGLGVFINALKLSTEHDCKLRLVNLQDRVLRLFQITGLHEIMDLNSTIRGVDE